MISRDNIIEVVSEWNSLLADLDQYIVFETTGFLDVVMFGNIQLYSDEDDFGVETEEELNALIRQRLAATFNPILKIIDEK
jgi:hypothetical protein